MDLNEPSLAEKSPLGIVVIAIIASLVALDIAALGIRLWSRRLQGLSLCFNDYAVLLAWPLVAGMLVLGILGVIRGGLGQHLVDVSPREVTFLLKIIPAAGILWIVANTLIKVSILHFYNAVFGINITFRSVNFTLAAVVVCFGFSVFLQELLLCRPFAKTWNPLLPGVCGSSSTTILAEAIINMLLDIAILSLPMPLVWRLQMTRRRKIISTIIFGLGFIVCVITILRIVFATQLDIHDITYSYIGVSTTTVLEPILGMIVSSLPIFPPTFKKFLGGEGDHESQTVRSSSLTRLRSNGMEPSRNFLRPGSSYPLADLDMGIMENEVIRSNSRAK